MTLQQLALTIYVIGGITQVVQLSVQFYALRRTPHHSIALLCISTAAGLLYLAAAYGMSILSGQSRWQPRLFWVLAIAFVIQAILGIWGTAALLKTRRLPALR
jgi:ABC-type multidrug transport system permease subunit